MVGFNIRLEEDIFIGKGKSPGLDPSIHRPGLESLEVRMGRRRVADQCSGAMALNAGVSATQRNLEKIQGDLGRAVSSPLKPAYRGKDYSPGAWTKQDEEEAELARKSDYFLTGDRQKGQRNQIPVMRFLSHAQEYSAIIYCAIALMMRRDASTVLA
jgi:hypothetical protein